MKKYTALFTFLLMSAFALSIVADNSDDTINPNKSSQSVVVADNVNFDLLDQIEVVIFGKEDVEIITTSDVNRPSLGGGYRSHDDIIFERSVFLNAKEMRMPQDEEAVDAGMAQMMREYNLTSEQLEEIFLASGYTFEEGRQQLQIMQTVNAVLDMKVRSNLIIPRKDVEAYYNAHPETIEATYTLERLFVPFVQGVSLVRQRQRIEHFLTTGKGNIVLDSGITFTINHSDVASHKQFIYDMGVDQIVLSQEMDEGFELLRLVNKMPERLKTLDESYRDIVDILRRPKYEELMKRYRETLMRNVSVVYI
jgi:hypothetical protein